MREDQSDASLVQENYNYKWFVNDSHPFPPNSVAGNSDRPRRRATVHCNDGLHHPICSLSDSYIDQDPGWSVCPG